MSNNADDLDWLAFQFVADELSDEERLAFEQRLGWCHEAREAVARAVQLTQAVVAAEQLDSQVAVARSGRGWRLAAWAALALAASLAAVVIPGWMDRSAMEQKPSVSDLGRTDALAQLPLGQLAPVWIETVDQMAAAGAEPGGEVSPDAASGSGSIRGADEPAELTTPDWMLAAVSGVYGRPSEEAGVGKGSEHEGN